MSCPRSENKDSDPPRSLELWVGTEVRSVARSRVTPGRTVATGLPRQTTSLVGGAPGPVATSASPLPTGRSSRPGSSKTSARIRSPAGSVGSGSYASVMRPSTATSGTTSDEVAPCTFISVALPRNAANATARTTLVAGSPANVPSPYDLQGPQIDPASGT